MNNNNTVIGAGWLKRSKNGNEYISLSFKPEEMSKINLTNVWINMMVNNRKSKPNHPDYVISASPKQQGQQEQKQQGGGFPRPNQQQNTQGDYNEEMEF